MSKNQKDLIKYAAIAAVAYFAYKYAIENAVMDDYLGLQGKFGIGPYGSGVDPRRIVGQEPGGAQGNGGDAPVQSPADQPVQSPTNDNDAPEGEDTAAGSGTDVGGGTNTPAGGSGGAGGDIRNQIAQAAANAGTPGPMHFWHWNFYLPATIAKPDPFNTDGWEGTSLGRTPTNSEDVVKTLLTLSQYWALIAPDLGLGGGYLTPVGQRGVGRVNHWSQRSSLGAGVRPGGGFV